MTPARIATAVLLALLSTAVCWTGLDTLTGSGGTPPPLSWIAVFGTGALVLVVIAAGLPVRNWARGKREKMLDPMVAARTAVLAKAAAYGGALITGWYLSQGLLVLPDLVGDRRHRLLVALIAAGTGIAVSVAGFVVQHWCRIPPEDKNGDQGPAGSYREGRDPAR